MLSFYEQRHLTEIEHDLADEVTLTELAGRLAGPNQHHRRSRGRWPLWLGAVLLALGGLALLSIGIRLGSAGTMTVAAFWLGLAGLPLAAWGVHRYRRHHTTGRG